MASLASLRMGWACRHHSALDAGFFHRASAAFRALADRSSDVSAASRAFPPFFPPFSPPSRPSATAAGFFLATIVILSLQRSTPGICQKG